MKFLRGKVQLAGGRAAIDFYLKNDPIDQINTARPLYSKLVESKPDSYYYVLVKPYSNSNSLYGNYELVIREEE